MLSHEKWKKLKSAQFQDRIKKERGNTQVRVLYYLGIILDMDLARQILKETAAACNMFVEGVIQEKKGVRYSQLNGYGKPEGY